MKQYIAFCGLLAIQIQALPHMVKSPAPTIDDHNMFDAIYTFAEQMETAQTIGKNIQLNRNYANIERILFAGMGGSGMAGAMTRTLVQHETSIAIDVHQNYDLPTWVNEKTLVICISYSGNTEETLSCFEAAHKKGAPIIGVTSGGTLLEKLALHNYDFIKVPSGLPPRAALGYLSVPLIYLMEKLGITQSDMQSALDNTIEDLKKYREMWCAKNDDNTTYYYGTRLNECMPVIYGEDGTTGCIATRWRAQFAENSKMIARTHILPELDHNEIVGWQQNQDLLKRSVVIWLNDKRMHPRNIARQKITKEVIEGMPIIQLEFEAPGDTWCQRMFTLVHLGDWISYWCAIEHKVNPTTIANIDTLKSRMRLASLKGQI